MRIALHGRELKFFFKYGGACTFAKCAHDKQVLFEASTCCADSDRFVKATGRRIALTRLLKRMDAAGEDVTRETRSLIWKTYFEHHADLKRKGAA